MDFSRLRSLVLSSLMAALMAAGAYIFVPIGPVPIVLSNLFVLLAGLSLGPRWGAAATALYLLMGAIGLPVFAGGKGGPAHFLGPTGGYLFGFLLAAGLTGWVSHRFRQTLSASILAVILGTLVIYAFGVPWLKAVARLTWTKAFVAGMFPFLLGDALKAAVAVILHRSLRPLLTKEVQAAG